MQRFAENCPDLLICQQPVGKLGRKNKNGEDIEILPQAEGKLENRIFYSDYAKTSA